MKRIAARSLSVPFLAFVFVAPAYATIDAQGYDENTIRPGDLPGDAPRFENYPASPYRGPTATFRVAHDPLARLFRTRLKEWAASEPNFAGHYILATWGCGTDCTQITIIDAMTGRIFHPAGAGVLDSTNVHDDFIKGDRVVDFRSDSRMLMLVGAPDEDTRRRGISFFVWDHDHLRLLRFVRKTTSTIDR
jgi:hypothetical protein